MTEAFLHYVWKQRNFNTSNLRTVDNEKIEIIDFGQMDMADGPDFKFAKVKINDILLAGHIELHVKASDWTLHKHQNNPKYNNVILHVVYESDTEITLHQSGQLPCLELKGRIPLAKIKQYEQLQSSSNQFIPCESLLNPAVINSFPLWRDRVLIDRLENKTKLVESIFNNTNKHYGHTFTSLIAYCLGLQKNADSFLQLMEQIPFMVLLKHINQPIHLEALLLGTAGFLDDTEHAYTRELQHHFQHFKNAYQLKPLSSTIWQKGGVRPANNIQLRIAQFVALINNLQDYNALINQRVNVDIWQGKLAAIPTAHWQKHYTLNGKTLAKTNHQLSVQKKNILLINGVVPFIFFSGKRTNNQAVIDYAIQLLYALKKEDNRIIKQWQKLGFTIESAADTQTLLQLNKHYCKAFKCLDCPVGQKLLK